MLGIRPEFVRPPWQALLGTILQQQIVPTPGVWYHLLGYFPVTVCVEGTFVGEVMILVSNADPKPDDAFVDCAQLGATFTGPGSVVVDAPWRWIKASVPTLTSGAIRSIDLFGTGPMGGLRAY